MSANSSLIEASDIKLSDLDPEDKKNFLAAVRKELVRKHSRKSYYPVSDIQAAARRLRYGADIHAWAFCMFASPQDFHAFYVAEGEQCDYVAMRSQVLRELGIKPPASSRANSSNSTPDWFGLDSTIIDLPFDVLDLFSSE